MKYDIKKVPRELLEEYAKQHLKCNSEQDPRKCGYSELGSKIAKAAEVSLRTRAEVDADIAKAVRDYRVFNFDMKADNLTYSCIMPGTDPKVTFPVHIESLLTEETSD